MSTRVRKNPELWQSYQWWDELVHLRAKHSTRIKAIERGDSTMALKFETDMMELVLYTKVKGRRRSVVNMACDQMIENGQSLGQVWDWMTSIKGLASGSLAAQVLAQIDDISRFETISKLWRYCGWGKFWYWKAPDGKIKAPVSGHKYEKVDGEKVRVFTVAVPEAGWVKVNIPDRLVKTWCSPYNKRLKTTTWSIPGMFIYKHTPIYSDLYNEYKEKQRALHPEVIDGKFTKMHLHNRAIRFTVKRFLSHLWVVWRQSEGLSAPLPYAHTIQGHTNYVPPQEVQ